jgi:hypothetical protein
MSNKRFQQITKQQAPAAQPDWIRKVSEYCQKAGIEPEELIYFHKFNQAKPLPVVHKTLKQIVDEESVKHHEPLIIERPLFYDGKLMRVPDDEPISPARFQEGVNEFQHQLVNEMVEKQEQPEEEFDDSSLDIPDDLKTEFEIHRYEENEKAGEGLGYLSSIRNHQRPKLIKGPEDI